jgi:hypothetical protein
VPPRSAPRALPPSPRLPPSYCEQSDIHSPGTTVEEALWVSGRLRLPGSVTNKKVQRAADSGGQASGGLPAPRRQLLLPRLVVSTSISPSPSRNPQVQAVVDEALAEVDLTTLRRALVGVPGGVGEAWPPAPSFTPLLPSPRVRAARRLTAMLPLPLHPPQA